MGPGSLLLMVAAHLVLLQVSEERSDNSSLIYKAAVVEYSAPLGITMDTKETYYQQNVKTFACIAERAAELDCDIVVFPEQGLHSIDMPKLEDGAPAIATRIPAPDEMVNPCKDDSNGLYKDLKELSCAARKNSIYLVVNVAEQVPCSSLTGRCGCPAAARCTGTHRPCPRSDAFIYNSNVAFDREGTVIARYRKYHLHGEFPLVQTAEPEYSVFDTDFGVRFGMFISFDMSFQEPATKLVTELGAHDIVFSSAWLSELPFQTAVQYQAAWSHAMDVNFLASGYNYPEYGAGGSGIYAGKMGTLVAVMPQVRSSYLLVSTLVKKQATCFDQFFELLPKGLVIQLPCEAGQEQAPPFQYDRNKPAGVPRVAPKSLPQAAPTEFTLRPEQPVKEIFTINQRHTQDKEMLPEMSDDEEHEQVEEEEEEEELFEEPEPEYDEESGSSEGDEGEEGGNSSDEETQAPEEDEAHDANVPDDGEEHPAESEDASKQTQDEHHNVSEHGILEATYPEDETAESESYHVEEVHLEVPHILDDTWEVETKLPHPCTDELHITQNAKKWLPAYVYPKNEIGSGLHINRERLEDFSTFLLTSENTKENSTVRMCHGTFCCDFDIILYSGLEDNISPHYHYRLVAFDGVRNMNEFGEGRYQICGVISCSDRSLHSCGQVMKDASLDVNYTRFHKLNIRGTFKSNNTIVGANTVAHNLLPLPASKFDYVSEPVSEDELNVTMESRVPDLTFLTFGIYARNYDADDFRINKIVCEV